MAQSVECRLVEENKALSMERSHLSDLMARMIGGGSRVRYSFLSTRGSSHLLSV